MPPAPVANSITITASSLRAVAATLFTSSTTWTRAFYANASTLALPLRRPFSALPFSSATSNTMTAATPAFATATAATPTDGARTANHRNVLSKLAGWRPRRLSTFASTRNRDKQRSDSISSVPSFILSSSSHSASPSDDSVKGAQPSRRRFSSSKPGGEGSKLSSARAQAAIRLLPSYLMDARAIMQYSPSTPEGALQLSVAENQLSELPVKGMVGVVEDTKAGGIGTVGGREMRLVDVLSQLASSNIARPSDEAARAMHVFETNMIYYQPTQGVPSLRDAMASYLQTLLVSPTHPSLKSKFNPDNVVLGAGCNAVLENLCIVLANPGDAVLIPTPYYAAFEFDLVARAGCHITPLTTFDHHGRDVPSRGAIPPEFYYPNRSSLDSAHERAVEETGRAPRVLLLSHPNNPLGICYPPAVVRECIDWCREREVHLISDEIYAGSVYRNTRTDGGETFVSAMKLGSGGDASAAPQAGLGLGPYVHLVYALSKDFALSGLRVGVAYTENEEILLPLQKLNDLCQISSQTQLLVERMLCANAVRKDKSGTDQSKKFVDVYLEANLENIRQRCDLLQSCLDELEIPYLPADSGLFVWMDFREFLPSLPESGVTEATESVESREQRERKLYLSLMKEYGLLFTPGMSMRNERAGFFRCVFTAASEEEFQLGLVRLRKFVEEARR